MAQDYTSGDILLGRNRVQLFESDGTTPKTDANGDNVYVAGQPVEIAGESVLDNTTLTGTTEVVDLDVTGNVDIQSGTLQVADTTTFSASVDVELDNDANNLFIVNRSSGNNAIAIRGGGSTSDIRIHDLPEFADETAASGQPSGTLYRTSAGVLMVKL